MAQKWSQKASVQASIAGGVFLLLVAVVTGLFGYLPKWKSSGNIIVNDIVVQPHIGSSSCSFDFRVMNRGDYDASVSRVRFKVITAEQEVNARSSYHAPSQVYHLNISELGNSQREAEYAISQVVKPGENDRFIVILTADVTGTIRRWTLEPQLVTSAGIVPAKAIKFELPYCRVLP